MRLPAFLRRRRGSVLVHVLVMTLVLGYIGASILHMLFQPSLAATNAFNSAAGAKTAEASVARLRAVWDANGAACSSNAVLGVDCSPSSGCACLCSISGLPSVQSTSISGGSCALTVTAP